MPGEDIQYKLMFILFTIGYLGVSGLDVSALAAQTDSCQDNQFSEGVPLDANCVKFCRIIAMYIYVADEMMSILGQGELILLSSLFFLYMVILS